MSNNYLILITGPTAVGKTDLCIKIAQQFNTAILSADSRQFYKELSIGTAKPSEKEMDGVKHYFINSHSVQQDYNVAQYEKDALALLSTLFKTHKIVILTGGSGLYIDAICKGFDKGLPKANVKLRTKLDKLHHKYGIEILQEKLKQLDPDYYKKVDLNNSKRLMRAIEVCISTGSPYSLFRLDNQNERPFKVLNIGLTRNRDELYTRINQRVDDMIKKGLIEEAKNVIKYRNKNALKTVGYRELFEYFDGNIPLEEAIKKIKTNSRNYARKQINWFKRYEDMIWFNPNETEKIATYINERIN